MRGSRRALSCFRVERQYWSDSPLVRSHPLADSKPGGQGPDEARWLAEACAAPTSSFLIFSRGKFAVRGFGAPERPPALEEAPRARQVLERRAVVPSALEAHPVPASRARALRECVPHALLVGPSVLETFWFGNWRKFSK